MVICFPCGDTCVDCWPFFRLSSCVLFVGFFVLENLTRGNIDMDSCSERIA
jgi:hypothetical protein